MGSIIQTTSLKGALIWMGTCDEETCEDFDLTPYTQGQTNEGIINFIYQVGSSSVGEMWKGAQPSMFNSLNGSDNSNTLFCGKCYYIMLNPAADSSNPFELSIPGAKFDFSDSPKRGRIFDISSGKAQFLGDISQLPSVIAKGQFQNLITDADTGEEYSTTQTLTTDKDGVYIKSDGSVHRFFSGVPFEIPAGSKLLKGKFGVLDTDGDGVPDTHDTDPTTPDRDSGSSGGSSADIKDTIAAGGLHSLVLKADGSLHASGNNQHGQLGDGTFVDKTTYSESISSGVAQVSAGYHHSLILKTDGSVHTFGRNHKGQLGDGTTTNRNTPVKIIDSGVVQISAGNYHSLILKSDGSLYAFGANYQGELGDGTTTDRLTPIEILPSGVSKIAAGGDHSMIIKSDGSLHTFGLNSYGQLGDGTTTRKLVPTEIIASGVAEIGAGDGFSLIVKDDGSVHSFGKNFDGNLGDGTNGTTAHKYTPTQIFSSGGSKVAAGWQHSVVLKADGSVWTMGRNYSGQLGDGTATDRNVPTRAIASEVFQISCGAHYNLCAKTDGSLHSFGIGSYGNFGDGVVVAQRKTPTQTLPAGSISTSSGGSGGSGDSGGSGGSGGGTAMLSIDNFLLAKNAGGGAVHSGPQSHVSFISREDTSRWNTYNIGIEPGMKDLYYAGFGAYSQLGNNSTENTKQFTLHQTFKMYVANDLKVPVVQVSAGTNHTLALKADGSVYSHGHNDHGQLGTGYKNTSVNQGWNKIVDSGAVQVSAGDEFSMVLMDNGEALGFGNNNSSRIGPSSAGQSAAGQDIVTPTTLATDVVYVSAGRVQSLIVKSDGTVWGTGSNATAMIGPEAISGQIINGYEQFASGYIKAEIAGNSTFLQKSNGSLWSRGTNNMGQLGDGTLTYRYSEVEVIDSGVEKWTVGGSHCLVIKEDGSLWGWGVNTNNQLTDVVSSMYSSSPVKILDSGVTAVAAGSGHTIVQQGDSFYTWGMGGMGQLGNNKDSNSHPGQKAANETSPYEIQDWQWF